MIGLIDNFDSFTYNIVALLEDLGEEVVVLDHHTPLATCLSYPIKAWILGPGPGGPDQVGVCAALLALHQWPILGICLGHQLIGRHFGGEVIRGYPHHGICTPIEHQGKGLFAGIPTPFNAVRYHSLVIENVPVKLGVTARTPEGIVMAIEHRTLPIFGVQFHPDSIATEYGKELIANFLVVSTGSDSLLTRGG